MNDIVPALLEVIEKEFDEKILSSDKVKNAVKLLRSKQATYLDANDFAIEVGEILASVLRKKITVETLPDGKMYFNIAERILNPIMQKNHELISSFAFDVQTELNKKAGLKIKGQKAGLNRDRIDGIVNKISSEDDFEKVRWLLGEPVVNFSQSIVDDSVRVNVAFQAKAGLKPKIVRREVGKCCDWCKEIVGTYDYPNVPNDIYRRHRFCKCTVDYDPGTGKKQNVHTKEWINPQKDDRIESRKVIGLEQHSSGAKNYIRDDSNDYIMSPEDIRKERHAYTQYDAIKNSDQKLEMRKIFSNIGNFKEMKDFTKKDVEIAFNHVFNDTHDLEKGKSLFVPDYDMAQSWARLISGKDIQSRDLILLRHERLERDLMYVDGMDYRTAHDKTDERYNYRRLLTK